MSTLFIPWDKNYLFMILRCLSHVGNLTPFSHILYSQYWTEWTNFIMCPTSSLQNLKLYAFSHSSRPVPVVLVSTPKDPKRRTSNLEWGVFENAHPLINKLLTAFKPTVSFPKLSCCIAPWFLWDTLSYLLFSLNLNIFLLMCSQGFK